MKSYHLNIKFIDGSQEDLVLSRPHQLTPDNRQPNALVYTDSDNFVHNIPFSSILDFWFKVDDFTACESSQDTGVLRLPTPNCDCASCKSTLEKIKTIANSR